MKPASEGIARDAESFARTLSRVGWKPSFWIDEGEACFEWINGERHAIVSIEGDGRFGYAMRFGGSFVSGREDCPSVDTLPADLAAYLGEPPSKAEVMQPQTG